MGNGQGTVEGVEVMSSQADALRAQIAELTGQYYAAAFPARPFVPGESRVPYAGRVFDADELRHLVDASLDFCSPPGALLLSSRMSLLTSSACACATQC